MRGIDELRAAVASRLRGLGITGLVVLAALVIDLAVVAIQVGPTGLNLGKLLLLPGIIGMALCAWYGLAHAVRATALAGVVLLGNALLLAHTGTISYDTVLPNSSLVQITGALVLVARCTQRARPLASVAAIGVLVLGALATVFGPADSTLRDSLSALVYGLVLLLGAVTAGLVQRGFADSTALAGYAESLRRHWVMVAVLAILLFVELTTALGHGWAITLLTVVSLAMAVITVRGIDTPARAALLCAGLLAASGVARYLIDPSAGSDLPGGVPVAQIGVGILLPVALVRRERVGRAASLITALTVAVLIAAVLNTRRVGESAEPDLQIAALWLLAALIVLGACIATGVVLRLRDGQRDTAISTAVSDAQTNERMALARELHDVVAHHVTGIVVQAQAAKIVAQSDPKVVAEALDRIESAGTEAMVAMRRLVASMRGGAPAGSSAASEQATTNLRSDLTTLIETNTIGVRTESDVRLPDAVPQELARSVLRLVQESLTNVGKHASGAALATVEARLSDGELYLSVRDDGSPGDKSEPLGGRAGSGGYGLVGMRERVELLNGRFTAGREPTGGWRVQAWLPWQEPRAEGET